MEKTPPAPISAVRPDRLPVGRLIEPPKTVQHREVFNRYVYKVHLDGVDEPLPVPVDHVAGCTARGDAVEPREIDLEGLVLYTQDVGEIENRLRLAGSRMLNYTAFARKRFRLTMNLAISYQLSRGDVIVVSSAYLFPHNPGQGRGVGTVPTRIVRIDRDTRSGRATLLVEYSAADGVGYAPELKVASAPAANQIVALANEYTEAQHPVTGEAQTDMQAGPGNGYFVVGDTVKVFRRGDWQNRVETTITAIDYATRTVTFAANVNAAAGWAVKLNMKARGYAHLGPFEDGSAQAYT